MNDLVKISAGLILLIAAPACTDTSQPDNGTDTVSNVSTDASSQTGDAPAAPGTNAGEAEVRTFLAGIYAPYASDDLHDTDFAAILEPQLANAVDAEGAIEVDPFIDAQDWTAFRPTYENIQVRGDRATATVRFVNFDAPQRIDYDLIRTPAGWRVRDVRSANGGSLRERLLTQQR